MSACSRRLAYRWSPSTFCNRHNCRPALALGTAERNGHVRCCPHGDRQSLGRYHRYTRRRSTSRKPSMHSVRLNLNAAASLKRRMTMADETKSGQEPPPVVLLTARVGRECLRSVHKTLLLVVIQPNLSPANQKSGVN